MSKLISYIRWFIIAVLLQLILIPVSYIIYPISYLLRKQLRHYYYNGTILERALVIPLWIVLDDEVFYGSGDDYGEQWWKNVNNIKVWELGPWQRFVVAYKWGVIRNPAWNQYQLFKPKQGQKNIVSERGELLKNGEQVSLLNFAVLKYVNSLGQYTDNQGEYLSLQYSVIGKSMVWYLIENTLYWRYSIAKKIGKFWIELQLGTNDRRYTVRFKIKKGLKIYENRDSHQKPHI
jgi:hypothetical protein